MPVSSAANFRRLTTIESVIGNNVIVDQQRLLNFASNNYLGLAQDPRLRDAAMEAIKNWGTSTGASPLLSGYTALHENLAAELAAWKCASQPRNNCSHDSWASRVETRLFTTGYAANLAVLTTLPAVDAQIFSDRKNHASLIDGLRLASQDRPQLTVRYYRHRDFANLQKLLEASDPSRERWIVSDSVFSMDGTCVYPDNLSGLANQYSARLVIDEAHATGVVGQNGSGLFSFSLTQQNSRQNTASLDSLIIIGTLSKSLGSAGGFVTASEHWINRLTQAGRAWIYSTSLPTANVAAASAAVRIAQSESWRRDRLNRHVSYLHAQLTRQGWQTVGNRDAPLLGIVVGTAENANRMAEACREAGIWAPAIRPPTVKPLECRIRLSPSATMTDSEIERVVEIFAKLAAAGRAR